ncbi:MAG TPA: cupin domain-containing protein, partial [Polyangiaceae bacterium]|nr:cupin domain-containing protein [Polyangiaceae bacterium]
MGERRHPNVVNVDEVEPMKQAKGGFENARKRVGFEAGGLALGCAHTKVEPGKTAFPFHYHSAIEEAVYILEGTGTLRIGTEKLELRRGDYVA